MFESAAVAFIGKECLIIAEGDHLYTLNIKTHERAQFKRNATPSFKLNEYAISIPCSEIFISSTPFELVDEKTLTATGNYYVVASAPVVCYRGDFIALKEGELEMYRNKHFILDLIFRNQQQVGYQIFSNKEDRTLQIRTPQPIVPPEIDMGQDSGSDVAWLKKMRTEKPTGNTLYELLSAFFEKYEHNGGKLEDPLFQVSYQDNLIFIKGLTDREHHALSDLLNSLLNLQPSRPLSLAKSSLRFISSQPAAKPLLARRSSLEGFDEDESILSEEETDQLTH